MVARPSYGALMYHGSHCHYWYSPRYRFTPSGWCSLIFRFTLTMVLASMMVSRGSYGRVGALTHHDYTDISVLTRNPIHTMTLVLAWIMVHPYTSVLANPTASLTFGTRYSVGSHTQPLRYSLLYWLTRERRCSPHSRFTLPIRHSLAAWFTYPLRYSRPFRFTLPLRYSSRYRVRIPIAVLTNPVDSRHDDGTLISSGSPTLHGTHVAFGSRFSFGTRSN